MEAAVSATTVAFAAVPVSLLLGALFDSLSDLTVRRWICGQGRGNYESFIKFLGQMNMLKSHDLWKSQFCKILKNDEIFSKHFGEIERSEEYKTAAEFWKVDDSLDYTSQMASAILLRNSNKDHFDWVISHYSVFYLASSLALATASVSFAILVFVDIDRFQALATFVATFFIIYLLLSLAAERFFYTHLCTYRFSIIEIIQSASKRS
jgi:hypothetical protein